MGHLSRAALEPSFKILLPRRFVQRPIEYTCRVSSTLAERFRSLRVLKMLTPDGRTDGHADGHLTGFTSHFGRHDKKGLQRLNSTEKNIMNKWCNAQQISPSATLQGVDMLETYGRRAFSYAGPSAWNSLPAHLRSQNVTINNFRHSLKTFPFSQMIHAAH